MKAPALLMAGVCSLVPALCGQQAESSLTVDLKPASKTELPLSRSMQMIEGVKCDGAGNIYGRPLNMTSYKPSDVGRIPIQEFTPDGKLVMTFNASGRGLDNVRTGRVFVDHEGTAYQVAGGVGAAFAIEFAKDGSVKSKTMLETGADVMPRQLAVFKSGRFLLIGEADHSGHTPYTAVFEPDGRLVKKIYEPEDEHARGQVEIGDTEFVDANVGSDTIGNNFVSEGDVTVAEDGNAYVMHGTSPTLVYVVSPAGMVVRKFRVASSEPGQAAWSIKSYGHRLAFAFPTHGQVEIQVTDLEGTPVAGYMVPTGEDVADLACYDSSGFSLISVDAATNLYVLQAKPR